MIQNARALQTDTPPREIIRRHDEMQRLATALRPVVDGDVPETTFLFGPAGAGKTCIANCAVRRLQNELLEVNTTYQECWSRTRSAVLRRIVEDVHGQPVHESTSCNALLDRLRSLEDHCIIVLDEVDQLANYEVIHDLYGIRPVTIIGIANRETPFFAELDTRIGSRMRSSVSITFNSYRDEEIVAILEDRAEWGLDPGVISTTELEYIASMAEGDARHAIGMLRVSAKQAQQQGRGQISREFIETEAVDRADRQLRETTLAKLTDEQRRLIEVLEDNEELQPREMYDAYNDAAPTSVSSRQIRKYRAKLVDYGLIEPVGPKPDRRYRIA